MPPWLGCENMWSTDNCISEDEMRYGTHDEDNEETRTSPGMEFFRSENNNLRFAFNK